LHRRRTRGSLYPRDPEEGALFGVFPRLLLDGEATAAQIVEALQQDVRKRYPDFEVKQQTIEPDPAGNGETASVRAGWTNGRSERMTTLFLFHIDRPGEGQSRLLLFNLQAPEVAFSAVEPTFHHMLKSYAS
jgi:hypothetical protein